MHVFPKCFFHKEIMPDGMVFHSQEQLEKAGRGWVHSPLDFDKPEQIEAAPLAPQKRKKAASEPKQG